MKFQASETLDLEQSTKKLENSVIWANQVLERLAFALPGGKLKILEIGSAQGRALIGLSRKGHDVFGIEPHSPAIQIAKELAIQQKATIEIREGRAEKIPFELNQFDLVLAFAVMEHVENLEESLSEISRVLKPGGIFWFSSASAMCPLQNEIRGFPFFGWYPDKLKKRIMKWSVANKPELVGFTEHPALHWWTPKNAKSRLFSAGLETFGDHWDLRLPTEDTVFQRFLIKLAIQFKLFRFLGNLVHPGCSYVARKIR